MSLAVPSVTVTSARSVVLRPPFGKRDLEYWARVALSTRASTVT